MTRHVTGFPSLDAGDWASGCIYYILSGETGRVKIGFTNSSPGKRLASLQTGSPTRIGIIAVHPGTPDMERQLHKQFEKDRLHGEWFDFSDDLLIHVAETCCLAIKVYESVGQPAPQWATYGLKMIADLCGLEGSGETIQ